MQKQFSDLIGKEFKVLDKGYIKVIDFMGDQDSVVKSARLSFGQTAYEDIAKNDRLRERLLADKHTSPFEIPKIQFEVKCPIFVARQWFRHRYGNYNEESLRYRVSDCEFYFPKEEDIRKQDLVNNQGGHEETDKESKQFFLESLTQACKNAEVVYKEMIARGITRELARIVLPVNVYTRFIWCVDLKTLMHFLNLRMEKGAQFEIRCYANVIYNNILQEWVPNIHLLFTKYIMFGKQITNEALKEIKKILEEKGVRKEDLLYNKELIRLLFQ